jgi:hypothetical protein
VLVAGAIQSQQTLIDGIEPEWRKVFHVRNLRLRSPQYIEQTHPLSGRIHPSPRPYQGPVTIRYAAGVVRRYF